MIGQKMRADHQNGTRLVPAQAETPHEIGSFGRMKDQIRGTVRNKISGHDHLSFGIR
jgi:hypothetical protein